MIQFPLIQELRVENYALYPGPPSDRRGLATSFLPGLTLVLGANGLGKTTLVWLLYRMLCGPYDISGLDKGGRLGTRRIQARSMPKTRRVFAQRVKDAAKEGAARLQFDLGDNRITVTRSLNNLTLLAFRIDDNDLSADEDVYQSQIAALSGVWSFGDWILLLRHLTFYFEDRRALVWDPTAQTQICRLLFLPSDTARAWTERERKILALDSQARNLNAAVTKEETSLAKDETLELTAPEIKAELDTLTDLQESDQQNADELDEAILAVEPIREQARLAVLSAEHEREAALRALEQSKLAALQEHFPTVAETARYILAQLFAEGECLACGSGVPQVAESLESRIAQSRCVLCDTPLEQGGTRTAETRSLSDKRISKTSGSLDQVSAKLAAARSYLSECQEEHLDYCRRLARFQAAIAERRHRMDSLVRQLPDEARELVSRRDELARLRARAQAMKQELRTLREEFTDFIEQVKTLIVDRAPLVKRAFERYAREFLLEDCELRWKTLAQRVGQTGPRIEFPVFELDLASASYRSPVRRSGPDEVSESQREFIDLAFRMALMETANPDSGATLIIDAPESSLDTVFVRKAADVLAQFGQSSKSNRLVVTSNITDGDLIPRLVQACIPANEQHRVVDLFEIAAPTAAVREFFADYSKGRARLWSNRLDDETSEAP